MVIDKQCTNIPFNLQVHKSTQFEKYFWKEGVDKEDQTFHLLPLNPHSSHWQ